MFAHLPVLGRVSLARRSPSLSLSRVSSQRPHSRHLHAASRTSTPTPTSTPTTTSSSTCLESSYSSVSSSSAVSSVRNYAKWWLMALVGLCASYQVLSETASAETGEEEQESGFSFSSIPSFESFVAGYIFTNFDNLKEKMNNDPGYGNWRSYFPEDYEWLGEEPLVNEIDFTKDIAEFKAFANPRPSEHLERVNSEPFQRVIKYVEERNRSGHHSYHPWFPSNRSELDTFWTYGTDAAIASQRVSLPPRLAAPYGKPITIVIDVRVLQDMDKGKRPQTDTFLHALQSKYEVILYAPGTGHYRLTKGLFDQYATYKVIGRKIAPWKYKMPEVLNRPLESTIILDCEADRAYPSPNNTLIVKPWDQNNVADSSLKSLLELLDLVCNTVVKQQVPVYEIAPLYHSVEGDAVDVYLSKRRARLF